MVNSVLSIFDVELDGRSGLSWLKGQLFRVPGVPKPARSVFLSRFGFLLPKLNEVGVEVRTYRPSGREFEEELKYLDGMIQAVDLVIYDYTLMRRSSSREFTSATRSLIRDRYLSKAHRTGRLNKAHIARRMEEAGIPIPRTMEVEEYLEKGSSNPVVLKPKGESLGRGVFYLTREQVEQFFDPKRLRRYGLNPEEIANFPKACLIQEFIETPGDRFTHYRVFTVGGEILGCVISASRQTKEETVNRVMWNAKEYQGILGIFRLVRNRRFRNYQFPAESLGTYPIISNVAGGGIQIPVYPFFPFAGTPTPLQRQVLENHHINVDELGLLWPSSGPASILYDRATLASRLLTKHGVIIAGQDWIQDKGGNVYFLEANPLPGLGIFNRLYFAGRAKSEVYTQRANSLIATSLKRYNVGNVPT